MKTRKFYFLVSHLFSNECILKPFNQIDPFCSGKYYRNNTSLKQTWIYPNKEALILSNRSISTQSIHFHVKEMMQEKRSNLDKFNE